MRSQLKITRRKRPKVILVPRKKTFEGKNQKTIEQMIAALKISSTERTEQDVDVLLQTVGKWPCFTKAVHSEQMRREVCRQMVYEEKAANTILFVEGAPPDGWYIVVTGEAMVVKNVDDPSGMADMPPIMVKVLKEEVGADKNYKVVFVAGPKSEFGAVALIKNANRNATIYMSQPSILIRVDNQTYRDTAAFFARTQLDKRTNLFSHVPQFQVINDVRDTSGEAKETFYRLAENTVDFNVVAGTIIDINHTASITKPITENTNGKTPEEIKKIEDDAFQKTQGFFIVAEGKLTMHRLVNFSEFKQKKSKEITTDVLQVRLPKGSQLVQIATLGPKTMFPDPRLLDDWIPYQFVLRVTEPVLLHFLKLSDLMSAVPKSKLDVIKQRVREQPDDNTIIQNWIEKQRAAQWLEYKKKCVKEAQREVKFERHIMNGDFGMRRAGIPKPIKDHCQFPPLNRKSSLN